MKLVVPETWLVPGISGISVPWELVRTVSSQTHPDWVKQEEVGAQQSDSLWLILLLLKVQDGEYVCGHPGCSGTETWLGIRDPGS